VLAKYKSQATSVHSDVRTPNVSSKDVGIAVYGFCKYYALQSKERLILSENVKYTVINM